VILTYGGIIQSLRTKDKNGDFDDITTGFDTIEEYPKKSAFFGTLVGRYANRIGGGKFTLNGKTYSMHKNNGGSPFQHSLHGGKVGFDKKVWLATSIKNGVKLEYTSADGEEGYPGTLSVCYELTKLLKNTIFAQKYNFCSKIQLLLKNTIFAQKYNFCLKIQFLLKNTNFAQKYNFCSKIQFLLKNPNFGQTSKCCLESAFCTE